MYEPDLIAGNMTGEPLGVLGAIDRGVYPADWRDEFWTKLSAWAAEQVKNYVPPTFAPLGQVPSWRDQDPVRWAKTMDAFKTGL